ncbi:2-phospho-L-lactate guanylyltransferase [Actinotalea ferrariae]|uniref:2-phospho-L-lactate guanylyltransferase n=1 Tax=Actinotalea ferrariae TaxID=1386098 RepID=UPI001FDEB135|nr:2-phospho-L-lactate guanylyltransferase [Actinotalea ferrariae]
MTGSTVARPTTVAVVPLRGPGGKTRLDLPLTPDAREGLVTALARRVLDALARAPEVDVVVVVTTDAAHAAGVLAGVLAGVRPGAPGAVQVLVQPPGVRGLNPAVELGRARARELGADRSVVLHADLPLLTPDDVAALLVPAGPVVLAPDVAGTGTNALVLAEPGAEAFGCRFGPGSRALHQAEARRLGLDVDLVDRPGTARDLDTAADWAALPQPVRDDLLRTGPARR